MNVIRPNCRLQLSYTDLAFISKILGPGRSKNDHVLSLLTDPDSRDIMLDDPRLYSALIEWPGYLNVSLFLFFYATVRHDMVRAGIDNRDLSDYIGAMLTAFCRSERLRSPAPGQLPQMDAMIDSMLALENADERTRFQIHVHVANVSLFMTGVFPEHLRSRAQRRGSPKVEFCEQIGSRNFRMAGEHPQAERLGMVDIFQILSESFRRTRIVLNTMVDRSVLFSPSSSPLVV